MVRIPVEPTLTLSLLLAVKSALMRATKFSGKMTNFATGNLPIISANLPFRTAKPDISTLALCFGVLKHFWTGSYCRRGCKLDSVRLAHVEYTFEVKFSVHRKTTMHKHYFNYNDVSHIFLSGVWQDKHHRSDQDSYN